MADFQQWAKKLHSSDNGALETLNLPHASTIKAVASKAKVYGFILKAAKPRLEQLFADRRVRSLRFADVAFDLNQNPIP